MSVAIGQGADSATPLQICLATAVVANGGTLYKPSLIETIRDPQGNALRSFAPKIVSQISDKSEIFRLIRAGMIRAVNAPGGTGQTAKLVGITVAAKTGTAQVVRLKQYRNLKEDAIPYHYRDHAWFTCFAPAEKPEIAVTVLVEHGLHGSSGAGPIAKAVLEKYFAARLAPALDVGLGAVPAAPAAN